MIVVLTINTPSESILAAVISILVRLRKMGSIPTGDA